MCKSGRKNVERMLTSQNEKLFIENLMSPKEMNALVHQLRSNIAPIVEELDYEYDNLVGEILGMSFTFGERINQHLLENGMKLKLAAEKLGMAYKDFTDILNDKILPWEVEITVIKELHEILSVPVDYLIQSIYEHPILDDDVLAYKQIIKRNLEDQNEASVQGIREYLMAKKESFLRTITSCF